jgi:excisionase family DNA binding protein
MEPMSTHDVARFCNVSPRTVLRWVDAGLLPGYETGGGRRRIRRDELLLFMRARRMELPPELVEERVRVAVVDDDALHVTTMERSIRALAPRAEVRTASDGFGAGALLYSFRPHLVLIDLVMPGLDGFEVCRRIRADPEFEGVGVVVQSSHLTPVVRTRLRELGVEHWMTKPVRRTDLEPHLRRFVPAALDARPSLAM